MNTHSPGEIPWIDIAQLGAAIASGELSPVVVTQAYHQKCHHEKQQA